ncbi:MBL fold metallo-hydrolase [Lysobacter sp. cf310]|uniref:MBL fold metallo-hydrolase n=1 Tax=Lysobacter sp. cf310 TaxID=1761790 RepID=UPI0008E98573|nr:MBL fold metallo-hydrolase [Lysobacter sp. cf310]SFK76987.1 L-ascorbate metabolism protein UlaG, beta-lactamase superfamily [Lysobacter sp. cf310]
MARTTAQGASAARGRRRWLKWGAWLGVGAGGLLLALLAAALISGCASFGAKPAGARLIRAQASAQWDGTQFRNPQPLWADTDGAWRRLLFGPATPAAQPDGAVAVVRPSAAELARPPASGLRITWFGHASALIQIDGGNVLIDPVWSDRISPLSWAGPQPWFRPPVALEQLPDIDAVLISHDHYDHLDRATVQAMRGWRTIFVVPLGVGAHLARWGIPEHRIVELDWWQSARVRGLELTATPARHKSGRFLGQSNQTLWAGYAIAGARHRVWYSGDTGFHDQLALIGERLGPFDATLIEAGQYDTHWPDTHLGPELAVEAHRLVRGKALIPVHWALIQQANHAWTEPVERVLAAARCGDIQVLTPRPGQMLEPGRSAAIAPWWPRVAWHSAAERPLMTTRSGDPSERVRIEACAGRA